MLMKTRILVFLTLIGFVFLQNCYPDEIDGSTDPVDQWIPLLVTGIEETNISESALHEYASQYRALECSKLSPEQRNTLREYNPDIILISYFATVSASENIILQHPGWAVRDSQGNPVPSLNSGQLYMLDPGNEELRNALVEKAGILIEQNGFDGIMFDEAAIVRDNFYNNFQGINPRTNQLYTIEEFKLEQLATLTKIRETYPGITIVANSIGNGDKYFDHVDIAREFALQSDLLIAESYRGNLNQALDVYTSEDSWLNNINMAYDLYNYGCALVANVEIEINQVTDENLKKDFDLYHYASFLTGYQEGAVFSNSIQDNSNSTGGGYLNIPVFNEFNKTDPGEPLSDAYVMIGQAYARQFTNMLVLINPKSASVSITLDAPYTDQDGNHYNTGDVITLHPNKAILLIK